MSTTSEFFNFLLTLVTPSSIRFSTSCLGHRRRPVQDNQRLEHKSSHSSASCHSSLAEPCAPCPESPPKCRRSNRSRHETSISALRELLFQRMIIVRTSPPNFPITVVVMAFFPLNTSCLITQPALLKARSPLMHSHEQRANHLAAF